MRLSAIALGLGLLAMASGQAFAATSTPPVHVTGGAISGTDTEGVRSY
ncbi:MAG: hypothetical protein JF571_09980, partial [Asticcacaulis sp.]|nr:hypothetical protein [Asticcacaulis sp.]